MARRQETLLCVDDNHLFPVVGVGASAGGLEAFTQLLKALSPVTGMAYVLVQHLDPSHESALTELLAKVTEMPVRQVIDATPVEPNHVYVIPPNVDMIISQGILRLTAHTQTMAITCQSIVSYAHSRRTSEAMRLG